MGNLGKNTMESMGPINCFSQTGL